MTALSIITSSSLASSGPASAARSAQCIALAQTLPAKLLRFIARYPSPHILPEGAQPTHFQLATKNPFFPQKFELTGRWHNPVYSSRRQADLVKLARKHGLQDLLPYSKKNAETKLSRKVALGWRGQGTGVGQQVKGHKHERMLGAKYVTLLGGRLAPLKEQHGGRFGEADYVIQDGRKERGHAQDAGAHQGMEVCEFEVIFLMAQNFANDMYRLDGRTGPSGPNKGLHGQDGSPSSVQTYIKYEHNQTQHLSSIACVKLYSTRENIAVMPLR